MALTESEARSRLTSAVVDAKGEFVGYVTGVHTLGDRVLGVKIRLDERLASLPTVARDHIEVSPRFLAARDAETLAMSMDLMSAIRSLGGGEG